MRPQRCPIDLITWIDAAYQDGQLDYGEELPLSTIHSVGFVIDETEVALVLARELSTNGIRGAIVIPKVAIQSRATAVATATYSDLSDGEIRHTLLRTPRKDAIHEDFDV